MAAFVASERKFDLEDCIMMDDDDYDLGLDTLRDDFSLLLEGDQGGFDLELPSPLDNDVTPLEEMVFTPPEPDQIGVAQQPLEQFLPPPNPQMKQPPMKQPPQGYFPFNQAPNSPNFGIPRPPQGNMISHYQKQANQQFNSIAQQMNQPRQMTQIFQNMFPFSQPKYITLTEGFINPVKERQPGGKDNAKCPLPKQVVELNRSAIPPNIDPSKLSCQCILIGYNKQLKQRCVLATLNTRRFQLYGNRALVVFEDLVVRFSSHLHGINGKLYLKLNLTDMHNRIVDSIESQGFHTITKRGLEKQRERRKRKMDGRRFNQNVRQCTPPIGLTTGHLLVKIHGEGFVASPLFNSFVTFGQRKVQEIISIKNNVIVCETPMHQPGTVDVNVSLDGNQFLQSTAKFQYVSPQDQGGIRQMMAYFMNPHQYGAGNQQYQNNNNNRMGGNMGNNQGMGGYQNQNNMPENSPGLEMYFFQYFNFITGKLKDCKGQNLFHHAASRGYSELLIIMFYYFQTQKISEQLSKIKNEEEGDTKEDEEELDDTECIEEDINNFYRLINLPDHFGRTPLVWALEAGQFQTAQTLLQLGADWSCLKDCQDNNILHVICDAAEDRFYDDEEEFRTYLDEVKSFLFFVLKEDRSGDGLKHCREFLELYEGKNGYGEKPMDEVSEENGLLRKFLLSFKEFVSERVEKVMVREIQIRSGVHNGNMYYDSLRGSSTSNSEKKSVERNCYMKFDKFQIEIHVNEDEKVMIPNDCLAFVILAKNERRVEFTLKKVPEILKKKWIDESNKYIWVEEEEQGRSHMMRSLSFFVGVSEFELKKIYGIFNTERGSDMYQFKPWSFVYRSRKVMKKKRDMGKGETQHVLQQKILNFKRRSMQERGIFFRRTNNTFVV